MWWKIASIVYMVTDDIETCAALCASKQQAYILCFGNSSLSLYYIDIAIRRLQIEQRMLFHFADG